jgi:Immunoglobulin-like domain of bacterial spore germination
MNKNILIAIAVLVVLGGCLYGAFLYRAPKTPTVTTSDPEETTPSDYTFTYLTSASDTTAFCDGNTMDSEGYRASITVPNTGTIAKPNPTTEEILHAIIDASTTGMCHTVMSQTTLTEKDGIVTISPIDAWAGFSISMCSCRPQVEVNILAIPGMKQVIWSTETHVDTTENTDAVILSAPLPNATVNSPFVITGKARGSWFFEASFPVYLIDAHGNMIGQGIAEAQSDWMTNDFVPFKATITFTADPQIIGDTATLVLQKDNPSGLHENNDALRVPVILGE